jgi:hypothetical protein
VSRDMALVKWTSMMEIDGGRVVDHSGNVGALQCVVVGPIDDVGAT